MTGVDELREIWMCQIPPSPRNTEGTMTFVHERVRRFDRMIRMRNTVECIAAGIVFIFFVWLATRTHDIFIQTGAIVIAASAAWIVFYLIRHGGGADDVDPSQALMAYTRTLVGSYDRQIRLLKSAKYWYLLPMYIGLMTLSVGPLVEHSRAMGGMNWHGILYPAIVTVVFAAVWWLNEVVVVEKLQRMRKDALAMAQQNELLEER